MMRGLEEQGERRRSYRVAVEGSGFLWYRTQLAGHYALSDISIGGCQLRHGPACDVGKEYRVVLHVERASMQMPARIVRTRYEPGGGCAIGLHFTAQHSAAEDYIENWVMRDIEHHPPGRPGRVLVLHPDAVLRRALCDAIKLLGYQVIEAGTPLEAVWELENGPMDIEAAFVAGALGLSDGRDIVKFISRRYPSMRRVLVDARSDSDVACAHAVLASPLSMSRLRKVMPRAGAAKAVFGS